MSNKYFILYIDESKDDIDDFLDYFEERDTGGKFNIKGLFPLGDIDEMIEHIFSLKPDAIVVDFKLNDLKSSIKYNIPYDGVKLVESILAKKQNFPCFVITSFDNDAIKVSTDVNIVYIKGILHGAEETIKTKATFIDKIEHQILHYQQQLSKARERLEELIAKSDSSDLNAIEEEELIKLDTFLESSGDASCALPGSLKHSSHLKKLHRLIDDVDLLLSAIGLEEAENIGVSNAETKKK